MEQPAMEESSDPTVLFCVCGDAFSPQFLMCWTALITECQLRDIGVIVCTGKVRASCIPAEMLEGSLEYSYVMWIDSCTVFSPDQVFKLIDTLQGNRDIHILSGLYSLDDVHYDCIPRLDREAYAANRCFQYLRKDSSICEIPRQVDYNGLSFALMRKGLFEAMQCPWFQNVHMRMGGDSAQSEICPEDVSFCVRAKEQGFETYIDMSVVVGKERTVVG